MTAPSAPRRRRRDLLGILAGVVAFALVYGGVVALYAAAEAGEDASSCRADPPADAVQISLTPTAVDAAGNRISATVDVIGTGPLARDDNELLAEPFTLVMTATDGPRTFTIGKGEIPSPVSVKFITTGDVQRWPFDRHVTSVGFLGYQEIDGEVTVVPLVLCGSISVPGWDLESRQIAGDGDLVVNGDPIDEVLISATRSAATVTFGIVLLALLIVLPAAGLTVAIAGFRGVRKVEATLMSWMAAMLFATVPLRTFLPGSPPIGSWVDYLVVLWVVAGLVTGLVVYVVAWLRWSPRGPRAVTTPDAAPAVIAATAVAAASTPPAPPAAPEAGPLDVG